MQRIEGLNFRSRDVGDGPLPELRHGQRKKPFVLYQRRGGAPVPFQLVLAFLGECFEGLSIGDFLGQLFQFPLRLRIDARGQEGPGLVPLGAGVLQGDLRIYPQSQQLLLAIEPTGAAPELGAGGRNSQVHAPAVAQIVGALTGAWRCGSVRLSGALGVSLLGYGLGSPL